MRQGGHTTQYQTQILAALLLALLPLMAFAGILPEKQSWAFMQSVGGISIGEPYNEEGTWYLPISCDVSGLAQITVKPTLLNSALMAAQADVKVEGRIINVTISTTMKSHNGTTLCKPVPLRDLPGGNYQVFYRDPDGTAHGLGRISLTP